MDLGASTVKSQVVLRPGLSPLAMGVRCRELTTTKVISTEEPDGKL
jgi:hypothetical protein